jgi:tRNA (cmo5U34)-methyltransferase
VSEVRDIWDEGAALHDEIYAHNVPYHRSHEVVIDLLPADQVLHVLDLGAGTGTLADRILGRLPEAFVTCVDFSPNMVARCQARLAAFGARVECICADLAAWAPVRTYDAVVTCNTLVYRELDIAGCYARYAAALDPGGLFLNSTLVREQAPLPDALAARLASADSSPPSQELLDFARRARPIATFDDESLALVLPIAEHLQLMTQAGLAASCPWRYHTQAVLLGVRP